MSALITTGKLGFASINDGGEHSKEGEKCAALENSPINFQNASSQARLKRENAKTLHLRFV